MMRFIWIALVGLGISGAVSAPVLACDNFVGGVCLDKKKAPVKKVVPKKVIKKKVAPKKVIVAPKVEQPAKPQKAAANGCVQASAGKPSSMDFYKNVVYSNVTFRNSCSEAITVYLQLNACKSPKAYFGGSVGSSRKKFKLRSGGSVSYRVAHQEGLRGASTLTRTNAAYGGASASYPKFGC